MRSKFSTAEIGTHVQNGQETGSTRISVEQIYKELTSNHEHRRCIISKPKPILVVLLWLGAIGVMSSNIASKQTFRYYDRLILFTFCSENLLTTISSISRRKLGILASYSALSFWRSEYPIAYNHHEKTKQ